jgi:DNA repair photolyase
MPCAEGSGPAKLPYGIDMAIMIQAKSMLRKTRRIDSWFVAGAGMNLYRGCAHDCAYCDGRAEKYGVKGNFAKEIEVKENALEVLRRELGGGPAKGRRNGELWPEYETRVSPTRPPGFIMAGGGVGDSYQPCEAEYRLTRGALQILDELGLPVHILTKSTMILRDLDVLARINGSSRAVVSFSICCRDDEISAVFEPGVPPPSERLAALSAFKEAGIACGVYLLPVIPFVTDSERAIDRSVREAKEAGADFVVFGGMTLKEGRQKEHFLSVLGRVRPDLVESVKDLYSNRDRWGQAGGNYYGRINSVFAAAARRYGMAPRMPRRLFVPFVTGKDLAIVLLEHIHAMKELEGERSSFGWAAYKLSRNEGPPTEISGIGKAAAGAIREILRSGTADLYEDLMARWTRSVDLVDRRGS